MVYIFKALGARGGGGRWGVLVRHNTGNPSSGTNVVNPGKLKIG